MGKKNLFICTSCGFVGNPKTFIKGNFIVELLLWILGFIFLFYFSFIALIPPFIYSLWRITTRYKGCRSCKGNSLIPVDSPKGQMLIKELNINLPEDK